MDAKKMKEKVQSFISREEIINKKERHKHDDGIIMPEGLRDLEEPVLPCSLKIPCS